MDPVVTAADFFAAPEACFFLAAANFAVAAFFSSASSRADFQSEPVPEKREVLRTVDELPLDDDGAENEELRL